MENESLSLTSPPGGGRAVATQVGGCMAGHCRVFSQSCGQLRGSPASPPFPLTLASPGLPPTPAREQQRAWPWAPFLGNPGVVG